jgi:hypothetical protein
MPSEKNTQVAGTLIPQESRTFRSTQLDNEENVKLTQKQQLFRKKSSRINTAGTFLMLIHNCKTVYDTFTFFAVVSHIPRAGLVTKLL